MKRLFTIRRTFLIMMCVVSALWLRVVPTPTARADYKTIHTTQGILQSYASPNGIYVVYVEFTEEMEASGHVSVADLEAEVSYPVVVPTASAFLDEYWFTPDGNALYFTAGNSVSEPPANTASLYVMTLPDGVPTLLLQDVQFIDLASPQIAKTADGAHITFSTIKSGEGRKLYLAETATQEVQELVPGEGVVEGRGVFSPDGNTVFFSSEGTASGGVWWQVPVTGGLALRVTPPDKNAGAGAPSPDGNAFYFDALEAPNNIALYRLLLSGGAPVQISPDYFFVSSPLVFSPDSRYGFYVASTDAFELSTLYRIDLQTFDISPLASLGTYDYFGTQLMVLPNEHLLFIDEGASGDFIASVYSVSYDPIETPVLLTDKYASDVPMGHTAQALSADGRYLAFLEPASTIATYYLAYVPTNGSTPAERITPDPTLLDFKLSAEGDGIFFHIAADAPAVNQVWYRSFTTPPSLLLFDAPPSTIVVLQDALPNHHITFIAASGETSTLYEGVSNMVYRHWLPTVQR